MDVKKLLNAAGATLGRIIQQAEETFLDIPRTEYSTQYKENVKKVDFLIILTEKLVTDFERFLQINEASNVEAKLMDNVVESTEKFTHLEEFGVILQNPLEEIKLYSPLLSKNLLKVGKYQIKLGEAFKTYLKNEGEIYMKKLRKMLEVDLKRFKDEELNLENLRLDHDYLKNRMDNAYTSLGKDALVKEYEKVKNNFECYLEKTTELFKTVDSYFTTHRILLKEFVEIQRNYYRDCDKYLTNLLRKMYIGTHNENNNNIQPNIISTECKVNSDAFENGVANGKVNLNISTEDSKPLSFEDHEIVTPQIFESENAAIEINDENKFSTDFCSELSCKIESNQNEIQTDKSEFSLNSSIDINPQSNGNLENGVEFKESIETEPGIICVNTNLENLIPDSTELSIDTKSESNLDVHTNLYPNLSDELIQPVINTNLENTTPEMSINIQNDFELQQNINLDETLNVEGKLSDETITIDNNLKSEFSEPNLTVNINSNEIEKSENLIQSEIESNLLLTKTESSLNADVNIDLNEKIDSDLSTETTKLDVDLKIEHSLQDSLNIKSDIKQLESEKLEGDISLGSITSNENITVANNVPDLSLNADVNIDLNEKIDSDLSTETTKLDVDLKIEPSLQDSLADIKSDIKQSEPEKMEGDISLGSIISNENISVVNNVPDLSLDLKESVIEESNVTREEASIIEPPKISTEQINVETTSDLSINTNPEIDVKLGLDATEVQISDEPLSLNQIKSDVTEKIEISEPIKENIDQKTEINAEIPSETIKSEINLNNENTSTEVKLDGGLSIEIDPTTPNISSNNESKDVENKSEIEKENSAKLDDVLLTKSDTENVDQINKILGSENLDKETKDAFETNINIEPYKVETESSLNLERSVEDSSKIEETINSENNQDVNANLSGESPVQLDTLLETKESEKEIAEIVKEDENNDQIESKSNIEEKTEKPEEITDQKEK